MCANYWNLTATFTCPECGEVNEDANLQTHFGDGYCTYYAEIGKRADWLGDMTVTLGAPPCPDDFIGSCKHCGNYFDFGGRIVNGVVMEVWPLPKVSA